MMDEFTLESVLAEQPDHVQKAVAARTKELIAEIDGLKELRALARKSQEQLATQLGVKQPSVAKMEKQTDLYLSTLRRFVEAAGGSLELRVSLPNSPTVVLRGLGELV